MHMVLSRASIIHLSREVVCGSRSAVSVLHAADQDDLFGCLVLEKSSVPLFMLGISNRLRTLFAMATAGRFRIRRKLH